MMTLEDYYSAFIAHRDLPDGRTIGVSLLITGTARLHIGETGNDWFDEDY